jgi:putative ABC transport system substrate-binding protein
VGHILKAANPGNLPFEVPTRYELTVNLKTAKATPCPTSFLPPPMK